MVIEMTIENFWKKMKHYTLLVENLLWKSVLILFFFLNNKIKQFQTVMYK